MSLIHTADSDGKNSTPVSAANPLPVGGVGGTAASRIASAGASVNATSAKTSGGRVYAISGYNAKASVVYLKFYDKATAPTVGTDVPALTLALPPETAFNINLSGHVFNLGIAYGLTTDAADNGTTALSSGDVLGLTVTYA